MAPVMDTSIGKELRNDISRTAVGRRMKNVIKGKLLRELLYLRQVVVGN